MPNPREKFLKRALAPDAQSRMALIIIAGLWWHQAWPIELDAHTTRNDGYKTAYFYAGSESLQKNAQWTSQSHQDELILSIFKGGTGFFVDLAANHAIGLSNSFSLERNSGWDGVCVEANPVYFWDLIKRRCIPVLAVVADVSDQRINFTFAGVFGGIKSTSVKNAGEAAVKRHYTSATTFRTTTLDAILRQTKAPHVIHYLSLDIEGAEFLALKNFPFDRYVFLTMTIERPIRQLRNLLSTNGYVYLWCFAHYGDTVWVHESLLGNGSGTTKRDVIDAFNAMYVKAPVECAYNLPDQGIRRVTGIEYPIGKPHQVAPG